MNLKQQDRFINEIIIDIYDEKGTYGGAAKIDNDCAYIDTKLELHFCDYKEFENFYNTIITLKKGIDKWLENNREPSLICCDNIEAEGQ